MEPKKQRTTVDRLAFSQPEDVEKARVFFSEIFAGSILDTGKGGNAFDESVKVKEGTTLLATIYYGGETQRGKQYIDITGEGCGRLDFDSSKFLERLRVFTVTAKLRWIDIALDFFHGEYPLTQFQKDYEAGKFTHTKKPGYQVYGDPYGVKGMTHYIGYSVGTKKKNGQKASGRKPEMSVKNYEKGKEQQSTEYPNWNRVELSLRPSAKQVFVPVVEIIQMRDDLFAGSYPALADLLPLASPFRLARVQTKKKAIDDLLRVLQKQWGGIIAAAVHHYEGDIDLVWEKICSKQPSIRHMP